MGEVYKARDTRPDRNVATKILPAHFADKPEHFRRFDREARAISRGIICTLCDVRHQDEIDRWSGSS